MLLFCIRNQNEIIRITAYSTLVFVWDYSLNLRKPYGISDCKTQPKRQYEYRAKMCWCPEGGGLLSQKVLMPGEILRPKVHMSNGGYWATKCACLKILSQNVLLRGNSHVNRRKDRHVKNITLAICVMRTRKVIITSILYTIFFFM